MDDLMSGDLKKSFEMLGYGGRPLWTNTGCAFFCYMDKKTCRQVKGAVHNVKLEYHNIDGCPLIRFDVKVYDQIVDPLHFDAFLNISNPDHIPGIEALTEQEWLVFHWYGPDFKYSGSTAIHWPEDQRQMAKLIIDQAKEIISRTGGGDFDRAKAAFMARNPLE
jgi:hypothetical protein